MCVWDIVALPGCEQRKRQAGEEASSLCSSIAESYTSVTVHGKAKRCPPWRVGGGDGTESDDWLVARLGMTFVAARAWFAMNSVADRAV